MIKKADIILALAVIGVFAVVLCAFLFFGKNGSYAAVTVNGETVATLPMNEDGEYLFSDDTAGYNLIKVKSGKAFVESADCRDQICVEHIAVSKEGEVIVCLPHKLTVEIRK